MWYRALKRGVWCDRSGEHLLVFFFRNFPYDGSNEVEILQKTYLMGLLRYIANMMV